MDFWSSTVLESLTIFQQNFQHKNKCRDLFYNFIFSSIFKYFLLFRFVNIFLSCHFVVPIWRIKNNNAECYFFVKNFFIYIF